ncbi:MAG: nicotinate-nucleotide adenylyltransferase [Flavobacteriales bacterium]|nr:nicotinate-nucleotide adenylyltransferase [Flavobacteriales bacterium]
MKVGLFFGSFNPIHIGHLVIANHIVENSDLDELWFVVTPHNPHKKKTTLLDDYQRLEMVRLAIDSYPKFRASDIEFNLPKPSYTIDTLTYLKEKYQDKQFILLIGEDNLYSLKKWKNSEVLIRDHSFLVYPRIVDNEKKTVDSDINYKKIDAPIIEISSTQIRKMIKQGKNIRPLLPFQVYNYIDKSGFYL